MHTLKDQVVSRHIAEHYPNARIVSWNDPDSGLTYYTADQLQNIDEDWFPLCAHLDPGTNKVVYGGRSRIVHTYTEGETGAGKTTRFAMQSIRALSSMKGKPSFLVVDIHGELMENLYGHLKENGYAVRILNCDDPSRSDTFNPFTVMARRCAESGVIDTQTINEIRKIAEIMQPIESTKDPIWDQGARSYTNGCILDKFEDLVNGLIPPECITLYNIIENHYWLRNKLSERLVGGDLMRIPHYKDKGPNALSVQKMLAVTNNAERTRASYFGVVENHYDVFGQPTLYQLSSSSTIDIEQFIAEPTAIFIQSGSTRIADDLLSLMTNEIYHTAVRLGKQSSSKLLPRKIHCFLDEFANSKIADGTEFIRMLTTSRKFGMYWHMLLQCDAQLDSKFDPSTARIIRANCTELFMGSHDYETTVRFAGSCGKKTVEALSSRVAQQNPVLTTVDLVTPDKLSLIQEGWLYIKSNRHPLLYSYIEAFYKCPEFVAAEDIRNLYPVNTFRYQDTCFTPDDIKPPITEEEFILLRYIHGSGQVNFYTLAHVIDCTDKECAEIIRNLVKKGYVREDEEHDTVMSEMLDEDYKLLQKQFPNTPITPVLTELSPEEFRVMDYIFHHKRVFCDKLLAQFPELKLAPINTKLEKLNLIRFNPTRSYIVSAIDATQFDTLAKRNGVKINSAMEDPLFREFREAAKTAPGYPNVDLSLLRALTCVPQNLYHYVQCATGKARYDPKQKVGNTDLFYYELLEAFIAANDFPEKKDWEKALAREFQLFKQIPYIPKTIVRCLGDALTYLTDELTIENIREIKRIISENTDGTGS